MGKSRRITSYTKFKVGYILCLLQIYSNLVCWYTNPIFMLRGWLNTFLPLVYANKYIEFILNTFLKIVNYILKKFKIIQGIRIEFYFTEYNINLPTENHALPINVRPLLEKQIY